MYRLGHHGDYSACAFAATCRPNGVVVTCGSVRCILVDPQVLQWDKPESSTQAPNSCRDSSRSGSQSKTFHQRAFSSACFIFLFLASKIFLTLLSPAIHFSTSTSSLPSSSFFAFVSLRSASLRFCNACRWSSNCCRAACSSWIRATVKSCSSLSACSGCAVRNSSGVVSGRLLKMWLEVVCQLSAYFAQTDLANAILTRNLHTRQSRLASDAVRSTGSAVASAGRRSLASLRQFLALCCAR